MDPYALSDGVPYIPTSFLRVIFALLMNMTSESVCVYVWDAFAKFICHIRTVDHADIFSFCCRVYILMCLIALFWAQLKPFGVLGYINFDRPIFSHLHVHAIKANELSWREHCVLFLFNIWTSSSSRRKNVRFSATKESSTCISAIPFGVVSAGSCSDKDYFLKYMIFSTEVAAC